jgi:lactoylglutathione lyase
VSRLQLALNVDDLDVAIAYYTKVFGVGPAKVRPGYANFAVANPPLKLVLIENPGADESVNHLGVEVESVDDVRAAHERATQAGLPIFVERETTCCYAVQDKFWIEGGEHRFEVYTVLADADQMMNTPKWADARPIADAVEQPDACCAPTPVSR